MTDLRLGDCRVLLAQLDDASVDAIVTDPPYELGFMGRGWDSTGIANDPKLWAECLRVLKPGGHLAAFGGTRTYHRMACAVEDAGFEIRDSLHWLYGSGFPKSLDVGKAIDKAAGAQREVVGDKLDRPGYHLHGHVGGQASGHGMGSSTSETRLASAQITAPATPEAAQWQGWGTALKPAHEPIVLARRPLAGTVAANVLAHGVGGLNVDGCRVATPEALVRPSIVRTDNEVLGKGLGAGVQDEPAGRWPANVLLTHHHDCDEQCQPGCPVAELDAQSAPYMHGAGGARQAIRSADDTGMWGLPGDGQRYGDSGGASRFYPAFRYQAKAPTAERPKIDGKGWPTVKPLALMRWLVRLVTPSGGLVLDPFAGTGATLQAAELEGFASVGFELDEFAYQLACQRLGLPGGEPLAHAALDAGAVEVRGQLGRSDVGGEVGGVDLGVVDAGVVLPAVGVESQDGPRAAGVGLALSNLEAHASSVARSAHATEEGAA